MTNQMAEKLAELRKQNGLSQEQLAEKLHISRQAVGKWERGEALPEIDNLLLLSQLYGVTVDSLMGQNNAEQTSYAQREGNPMDFNDEFVGVDERFRPKNDARQFNEEERQKEEAHDRRVERTWNRTGKVWDRFKGPLKKGALIYLAIIAVPLLIALIAGIVMFASMGSRQKSLMDQATQRQQDLIDNATTQQQDIIDQAAEQQQQAKDDAKQKQNLSVHNGQFNGAAGTNRGTPVGWTIDDVIENNKKAAVGGANGRVVSVTYHEQETSDPEQLKDLKSKFDKWTEYEVSVEYDEEGYIYKIIIEDIG